MLGKHFAPVGDKNWKLKGVHKLPSADELSEIIKLVDEFYTIMPDKSDEDMECISVTPDIDPSTPLSGKELEQYIMNLMNQDLTVTDFINISQLGKSLRKKFWKNTFIIAGIVIVVAGGVYYFKKRNKVKEKDEMIDEIDLPDEDDDDDDLDDEYEDCKVIFGDDAICIIADDD